jgi:hypothetical protein
MFSTVPRDNSIVPLDADKKAVVTAEIKKVISGLHFMAEQLEKDELEVGFGKDILSVTEFALANITKQTGIATQSAADIEERHRDLRTANMRVHKLEAQIGAEVATPHIQMGIKSLGKKLRSWWRLDGFGHISSTTFTEYGSCEVEFSCMLFGNGESLLSETPITDKERTKLWRASLTERGFVLSKKSGERESVVDCEASRTALLALLNLHLPSCQVVSLTNHGDRDGEFVLRGVKVFIRNLDDINSLPQSTVEED